MHRRATVFNTGQRMNQNEEEKEEGEEGQGNEIYIRTAGQEFQNTLMAHLLLMLQ